MTVIFDSAQIIFDTETTGINRTSKVLEIGAVVLDREGKIVSEFQTFVHQPRTVLDHPTSARAFEVHQIEKEDILRFGLTEEAAGVRFARWIEEAKRDFGVSCIRSYNNSFDIGKVTPYPIGLFYRVQIDVGPCLMLASMPPMISANVAIRSPDWVQTKCDYRELRNDDPERYQWPKASKATEFFESLGYVFPQEVEHRALPDARREAGIAVAIRSEGLLEQGIISDRVSLGTSPQAPLDNGSASPVHKQERTRVLKEMKDWTYIVSQERYVEFITECKSFRESEFKHENPMDWVTEISFNDTFGNGDDWILKYGERRLHIISEMLNNFNNLMREFQEHECCHECGNLIRDDDENVVDTEGGIIIEQSKGWEDGAWYRLGCDTCDFEWANETY